MPLYRYGGMILKRAAYGGKLARSANCCCLALDCHGCSMNRVIYALVEADCGCLTGNNWVDLTLATSATGDLGKGLESLGGAVTIWHIWYGAITVDFCYLEVEVICYTDSDGGKRLSVDYTCDGWSYGGGTSTSNSTTTIDCDGDPYASYVLFGLTGCGCNPEADPVVISVHKTRP